MTHFRFPTLVTLTLLGVVGCTAETTSGGEPVDTRSQPAQASEAARQIEAVERSLDVGKVLPGSAKTLEQVAKNGSADERDSAAIALSRTYELEGKTEAAIKTLEDLLARHREDVRWGLEDDVDERLVKLVTGKAAPKRPDLYEGKEPIAAFARAIAPSFQPDEKGAYEIEILEFGGWDRPSDQLGTFDVGGAIREAAITKCPLCEKRPRIHTHRGRSGSWASIPKYRDNLDTALVVFFYDQTFNRIPSRYDRYLPLPSTEIEAKLASGQGLVAVKQRTAAPPVVLIAAPRPGQLEDVEKALAQMSELPEAPVSVPLAPGLRPDEIRAVVRDARKDFKTCYDALLQRDAQATGRVTLAFDINAEGNVENATTDPSSPALEDAAFLSCFQNATQALQFPKTQQKTTVKYPLTLTP